MSFNQIKELRQAGQLEEALQLANQNLEAEPDNIWNKRAIAWVYYEYLKKYSSQDTYDLFIENVIKLQKLQLPESEHMVFDTSAWQIGRMIFSILKQEPLDFSRIDELFDKVTTFHFTKPSESYSFLYKAFHKGYHNWSKYLLFADWWNFENFRSEDFLKEEFNDKKIMALAEQAYIAYSKKLLEGEMGQILQPIAEMNKERIQTFLPKLDAIIEKHPEYQYPAYFKAKLLLAIGSDEDALSSFLPFAKQKRNDFWVWDLMAEIYSEDKELHFACYCKALSLKTPEDFLVKLRANFASLLVERQFFDEAKTEIEKVIATRTNHEWTLPNQITLWMEQAWYKSATPHKDNRELYKKYLIKAEEILFKDTPEEIIAIEFVNSDKKVLNFIKDKRKRGFFNYSSFIRNPKIGELLKVRFADNHQGDFYKLLSCELASTDTPVEVIKKFSGEARVIEKSNIAFVEDVFLAAGIVNDYKLQNKIAVTGRAILSYNKKKEEWGWKAFEIDVQN